MPTLHVFRTTDPLKRPWCWTKNGGVL